jgi:hypothetical protein
MIRAVPLLLLDALMAWPGNTSPLAAVFSAYCMIFFYFPVDRLVVFEHLVALLNIKFTSFEFLKLGSNYSYLRVSKFSHHN